MSLKLICTLISYISFLLLIMPSSVTALKETLVMILAGTAVIILARKKLNFNTKPIWKTLVSMTAAMYFGFGFYDQWDKSPKLSPIASALHVSVQVLAIIGAVVLAIMSVYFLVVFLNCLKSQVEAGKAKKHAVCCFIVVLVTTIVSQLMMSIYMLTMGLIKFLFCMLIVAVPVLAVYAISGKIKLSAVVGTVPFMLISTINVYVYKFRGRLFEPLDIFSVGTAMNVAENYSLWPIPWAVIVGWLVWGAAIAFIMWLCRDKDYRVESRNRLIVALACAVGVVSIVCYAIPLKPEHWNKNGVYLTGFYLDFVSKLKELHVEQPDGYIAENINEIAKKYMLESDDSKENTPPHIIVIMNESFADLETLGRLPTNIDVAPYISSLKDGVVYGSALASVYGGNTANSEYELLTGNTMAFLSPNAVPYQQYIKSPTYSMATYLKGEYGYSCIAMHPFEAAGWNRPMAYKNLGFDEFMSIENFQSESIIREYVSDREMYEKIIDVYENHGEFPLFIFGVTMQNHGGYNYRGEDFEHTVTLTASGVESYNLDQYLTLIHESDKAVEYLISYFENADENVVILFFGDHHPKLSDEFYAEAYGKLSDSIEDQQLRYRVPFFIWANYEIEGEYVEHTSLNYLSSYLYRVAGVELPAYNKFLCEIEEKIPAINPFGFYSAQNGEYVPHGSGSDEEKALLEIYECVQYNGIFDNKNRSEIFFPKD